MPLTIGSAGTYCASCNRWSGIIDDMQIYTQTSTQVKLKKFLIIQIVGTGLFALDL